MLLHATWRGERVRAQSRLIIAAMISVLWVPEAALGTFRLIESLAKCLFRQQRRCRPQESDYAYLGIQTPQNILYKAIGASGEFVECRSTSLAIDRGFVP